MKEGRTKKNIQKRNYHAIRPFKRSSLNYDQAGISESLCVCLPVKLMRSSLIPNSNRQEKITAIAVKAVKQVCFFRVQKISCGAVECPFQAQDFTLCLRRSSNATGDLDHNTGIAIRVTNILRLDDNDVSKLSLLFCSHMHHP